MKRWSLSPSTDQSGTTWGYGGVIADEGDVKLFISITPFQETSEAPFDADAEVAKAFCHMFVEKMPSQALSELLEAMKRILDFYRETPPVGQLPTSSSRQVRPKVGVKYERPRLSQAE